MQYLTIKEVSQITGVPPYTLRFWGKEFDGILIPSRTNGGQRRYTGEDISIIERIKLFKEAGISLNGIKKRLGKGDKASHPNSDNIDLLAARVGEIVKNEVYKFYMNET